MFVLVTGATGFVGSQVVAELLAHGHTVLGLARSEEAVQALEKAGVEAFRGDLADKEKVRLAVEKVDGVIHTAFNHDPSAYVAACAADADTISYLGSLVGTTKPLVVTSGNAVVGVTPAVEDGPLNTSPRAGCEAPIAVLAAAGTKISVVRLPQSVHGAGDKALVPGLIAVAKEKGFSGYIGDGQNSWAAVSVKDAATVFRLALEKGAIGGKYHGVAEGSIKFKELAEVIAGNLGIESRSVPDDQTAEHFGWLELFVRMDAATESKKTREELGWEPVEKTLFEDLKQLPTYN